MVSTSAAPSCTRPSIAPHISARLGGVQAGRRLVEEHDRAVHDQAGGEVQPPPHPAAVGADLAVGGVRDPEALEQLAGARATASRLDSRCSRAEQHQVLAPGQALVERGLLAGERDRLAHGAAARRRRRGRRRTRGRLVGASSVVRMRTAVVLPGAVVAEQPEHGARRDGEVQAAQRLGLAEAAGRGPSVRTAVRHRTAYDRSTLYECQGSPSRRSGRGPSRAAAASGRRCRASRSCRSRCAIADEEGLEAVSMRRLAQRAARGRDVALPLLRQPRRAARADGGHGRGARCSCRSCPRDWRDALVAIARHSRAMFLNHPWMLPTLQERPRVTPEPAAPHRAVRAVGRRPGGHGRAGAAGGDRDRGRRLHDRLHAARARGGHARRARAQARGALRRRLRRPARPLPARERRVPAARRSSWRGGAPAADAGLRARPEVAAGRLRGSDSAEWSSWPSSSPKSSAASPSIRPPTATRRKGRSPSSPPTSRPIRRSRP